MAIQEEMMVAGVEQLVRDLQHTVRSGITKTEKMEDAAAESVAEARCRERGELGQRCFYGSRQTYTRSCDL
ncbi:unnamed protein product [Sphagnum troendelagicum]|uniref:Uncharacterized protein n=1 Tax=Sphagnum troendelagicum TaxID=128251 RepID=A0ABP0U0Q9_9BRYO